MRGKDLDARPSVINPRHATAEYDVQFGYDVGRNMYIAAIFDLQDMEHIQMITIGMEPTRELILVWAEQTLKNFLVDLPEAQDFVDRSKTRH